MRPAPCPVLQRLISDWFVLESSLYFWIVPPQTQVASAAESAAVATTSVGFPPQVGAQPILMMDPNQVPNGTNSLALVPSNMSSTVPAKVYRIYFAFIHARESCWEWYLLSIEKAWPFDNAWLLLHGKKTNSAQWCEFLSCLSIVLFI